MKFMVFSLFSVSLQPGLLAEAHCTRAKYLFQQDKVYDCSYDTGDKSIQCGRKIDAFKFWVCPSVLYVT